MGWKGLEMWFIACLLCMRLLVWAKDFKVARRGANALRLYLFLISGSESCVTRRDAGLFHAMHKDRVSQLLRRPSTSGTPLDITQEHSSQRTEENGQCVALHSDWEEWLGGGVACRGTGVQPHVSWPLTFMHMCPGL